MKMSGVFTTVIHILKLYAKEHPGSTFEIDGKPVRVKDLVAALTKLLGWLYKDLTTETIERITRCYDCQYYKKYKKRGAFKGQSFYACSIDRVKHRPDFYCANGEPKR